MESTTYKNPVSGEIKKVTLEEMLVSFPDRQARQALEKKLTRKGVSGCVLFRNIDMSSSNFGAVTAVLFGPECTHKSPATLQEERIGSVPSQFQYPVAYLEARSQS